jgi:hypothetical protein
MRPGDANGPESAFALRQELGDLRAQLSERERAVSVLTAIVERQIGLLERYDAVFHAPGYAGLNGTGDGRSIGEALDRTLVLLEQAVAGVEKRARHVVSLEDQLDRALQLLDQSLRNQEAMVERGFHSNAAATSVISPAIEQTLAKYDGMLERSLAALEAAYRATQMSRTEIGERDKLLSRTLDLLENTVEANGAGTRRPGLFGRLFA